MAHRIEPGPSARTTLPVIGLLGVLLAFGGLARPSQVQADTQALSPEQAAMAREASGPGNATQGQAQHGKAEGHGSYHAAQHGKAEGHGGHHGAQGGTDAATATHRFEDPARWSKVFDDPKRDAWQKPDEVVKALDLKPGNAVADIGAGTGYFGRYLAKAVGETGTVYAVDVEPNLIGHLRQRAEKEGLANLVPVLASYDNPRLPRGSLDVMMIVDTYHHIDGRIAYFQRVRPILKPGGRVVVIDFHKRDLPVGPKADHKLDQKQVIDEMQKSGYQLQREVTTLPYQYILVFQPKP